MSLVPLVQVSELRERLSTSRAQRRSLGVVLTMGALHEGHLSLIRAAAEQHDEVLTTVFVNPTQFGPNEDLSRYPRDLSRDAELALGAGTTLLFSPSPSEMYPNGEETRVAVPGLAAGLCGKFRPGHFEGVATVVAKFFNLIGEGSYFFGKKDYQQWKVIERLACDLLFPVRIVGRPTVREADGLAMSSRNVFLDERQRQLALRVPKALQAAIDLYRTIEPVPARYEQIMRAALESNDISVEYAEVRRAGDLSPLTQVAPTEPALAAIAVRLGSTRLIDNVVLAPEIQDLLPAPSQDGNPP